MVKSLFSHVCLALAISSSAVYGLRMPIQAGPYRRAAGSATVPLQNFENNNYNVNITLGGKIFTVLIDTGSADLWLVGDVPNAVDTGKTSNISYASGSVAGKIMKAPLSFGGYDVAEQAFLSISDTSTFGHGIEEFGISGVIGLSPPINSQILKTITAQDAVPPIDSIFMQNKTSQNYITAYLSRDEDPQSTAPSQLTISEPLVGFESILQQTKLPVALLTDAGFNSGIPQYWVTETDVDGILGSDGKPIKFESTEHSTWNGTLAAAIDHGMTVAQVPAEIATAIYSNIPGAVWNATFEGGAWLLPCTSEVNITFVFGGQKFFIHPLDTVASHPFLSPDNGTEICSGAFQPLLESSKGLGVDIFLGMSFLRNAYVLLDYGEFIFDSGTDRVVPFIQMLSLTDPAKAHADFVNVRLTVPNANTRPLPEMTTTGAISGSKGTSWFIILAVLLCVGAVVAVGGMLFWRRRRGGADGKGGNLGGGFFMFGQRGERKYRSMADPVPAGVDDSEKVVPMQRERVFDPEDETSHLTHLHYQDPFQDQR